MANTRTGTGYGRSIEKRLKSLKAAEQDIIDAEFNVLSYGAHGDGVQDDSAAVQAAVSDAAQYGGAVYIPAGNYVLNSGLVIDESATLVDPNLTSVSFRGEGSNCTQLAFTGTGNLLTWLGGPSGGGIHSYQVVEGLSFWREGDKTQTAFEGDNLAFFRMSDCKFRNFELALNLKDCLSSYFENLIIRDNKYGVHCFRDDFSRPNALTFMSCNIAGNIEHGVWLTEPSTFNMYGGAIEGCGVGGAEVTRWGMKIDSAGTEGSVGVALHGVYFEFNQGDADLWIDAAANDVAYSILGCSFNRIDDAIWTTNNIRIDTGALAQAVNIIACGFKGFNDYVPNAGRPYINVTNPVTATKILSLGNHFQSATETPAWSTAISGFAADGIDPTSGNTNVFLTYHNGASVLFKRLIVDGSGFVKVSP